jgi:protein gp37
MSTTPTVPESAALATPAIARIRTLASELEAIGKTALSKAIECGRLLSEAKEQLGHGAWLPWLSDNFTFKERTAQRWMKLADDHAAGRIKYDSVTYLSEAYASTATPKPPPPAPAEDDTPALVVDGTKPDEITKPEPITPPAPTSTKPKATIVTADGRKTQIDKPNKPTFNETNGSVSWAKWTWNPVTGCDHGCKFCYAREIAHSQRMAFVYPFQFAPAFHDYRLEAPKNTKRPTSNDSVDGRVFVCSMADLFGKWVPDEWIKRVFAACLESPEWEYLFLTKWPKRYTMLASLPKAWFGASIIKQGDVDRVTRDMTAFETHGSITRWVSLEPMLEPIVFGDISWCNLMVIGAQTSTNQPEGPVPAFAPKFEWVADVVKQCQEQGVPYYLKPNLSSSPGMQMAQMEPSNPTK